jgi:glucoamylase
MPRDLPIGNGRLLVCFDQHYQIRDLYYPHVGQENHVSGEYCRLGVWVDGRFAWIGPEWRIELLYESGTLVTKVSLFHEDFGLLFICQDTVDFHENLLVREITVENMRPDTREIRLFFSHDLNISGNNVGDTAAFDPESGGVVHYKGARYFLVNGHTESDSGLSQFAVGQKGVNGKEGAFKDAEDGELSGNAIAQGSVDSVIGLFMTIPGHSKGKAYHWLAAGDDWNEVRRLDQLVKHKQASRLIRRTADYWTLWVNKETPPLDDLPDKVADLYRRSLLVLNSQADWQGGITAANDSDVIAFNRDTYSYVWPRDGALVARALDLAGYPVIAQRFFSFAARVIEPEGYFLHKYNPDGTLASSWHPWQEEGRSQLPIQEDETALVLWALWHHFVRYRDIEFIKPLYRPLIKNAADFMMTYRDAETGLPDASYDLWEERRGHLTFTTGAVFGGLTAASLFCKVFGETERADSYQQAASEIRDAASAHLWQEDKKRFCRMLYRNGSGKLAVDAALDASLWGLFAFGMYDAADPRVQDTMTALREELWVNTEIGGIARYVDDPYHRKSTDDPANPWIICTLWYADYLVAKAHQQSDLEEAIGLLEWVADHALPSGVLAEQVDPHSGQPLSVSPLTWSHATLVTTIWKILKLQETFTSCPKCGKPAGKKSHEEDWLATLYGKTCDTIHGLCQVK